MESRINKLRTLLIEQNLDAVLISTVPNIYYLTAYGGFSSEERDAFVLVTKTGAYVITNALYYHAVKEQVKHMHVFEYTRDNPFSKILEKICKEDNVKKLGFENHNLTVFEYSRIEKVPVTFVPVNLETLRSIKSPEEVAAIKKACKLGDKAFTYICTQLKEGITEKELAHKLELFIKSHDADISFRAIVAFGKNAAVPHHFSGLDRLRKNTCVLLDFGVKIDHYCSDMTRTVFFGSPTTEQEKVYQTVLEAQNEATAYIQRCLHNNDFPIPSTIDQTARNYVTSHGYPPFNHSSHGIGLEVHEYPHMSSEQQPMENGMVFSIEPGIYLPGEMGVRIEDLFVIQNNKLIQLTNSPKDLIQL